MTKVVADPNIFRLARESRAKMFECDIPRAPLTRDLAQSLQGARKFRLEGDAACKQVDRFIEPPRLSGATSLLVKRVGV